MDITLPTGKLEDLLDHPLVVGLLETSSDGAVVIDAATRRILGMNSRARDLLDLGPDAVGCECSGTLNSPACRHACPLTRAVDGVPAPEVQSLYYRRGDDQVVPANARMLVIRAPDGTPLAGIELIEDLRDVRALERALRARRSLHGLAGRSQVMQSLYDRLEELAATDLPVLLAGPAGVGKRRAAEALYAASPQAHGPLHTVEARALCEDGAAQALAEAVVSARGGVLLLVGAEALGSPCTDVLTALVQWGRADLPDGGVVDGAGVRLLLTARSGARLPDALRDALAPTTVRVPPLGERLDDLPLLAESILAALAVEEGGPPARCADAVLSALARRPWPGNVRELEQTLRVAALRAGPGGVIDLACLDAVQTVAPLAELEARAIQQAVAATDGNVSEAARMLGIDRTTLWRKLKRLESQGA